MKKNEYAIKFSRLSHHHSAESRGYANEQETPTVTNRQYWVAYHSGMAAAYSDAVDVIKKGEGWNV